MLRMLKNGIVSSELEVAGPPTCLSHAETRLRADHVLYGTSDGKVGLVQWKSGNPIHLWELCSTESQDAVLSLQNHDLMQDGSTQLIVAYEDGLIELYTYDDFGYPTLLHVTHHKLRLTSVRAGHFSHASYPELVCVTYAGTIFGLTTEPMRHPVESAEKEIGETLLLERVEKLREEINCLEKQAQDLRAIKFSNSNQVSDTAVMVTLAPLPLIHTFHLDAELAVYHLRLESTVSIDHVTVQCDCLIELLDQGESTAIRSDTSTEGDQENLILTTYRCQANTTHLTIQLRTIEGQYGTLKVYVVPRCDGPVACRRVDFPIHPLSLHRRAHCFVDHPERPLNKLTLSGKFSISEMHQWVRFCLPETPEKPCIIESTTDVERTEVMNSEAGEMASIIHLSTFIGSQLQCSYQKQKAEFKSDNISIIAILKDVLTKEATQKKIHLSIELDIHPESYAYTLRMVIHPQLEDLISLARKMSVIQPLRELIAAEALDVSSSTATLDGDTRLSHNLPADLVAIWRDASKLQTLNEQQPRRMERLYGSIVDLFIDHFRFQGIDAKHRISQLLDLLHRYSLESILQFFRTT